ncbi:MAG: hypothetical protein AB8I08_09305 [Sandaracinaceae bacterium]
MPLDVHTRRVLTTAFLFPLVLTACAMEEGVSTQPLTGNLLPDPGFESGRLEWSNWQGMTVVNDGSARSGSWAGRVTRAATDTFAGGDIIVSELSPSATYVVQAHGRAVGHGEIQVKFLDAGWNEVGAPVVATAFDSAYGSRSFRVTLPENATRIQVVALMHSTGHLDLDDLYVGLDGPQAPCGDDLHEPTGPAEPPTTGEPPVVEPTEPPPSASAVNSVDTIIDDMTQPASARARDNNEASVIFSGNYEQAQRLSPTYAHSINNITSWCWAFAADGHPSDAATAVQVRHHEVYALRRSTGRWEWVAGGRPSGWRGNLRAATYELQDEEVIDADVVQVRPGAEPRTDLRSYELWTPGAADQIDFWWDVQAVFATCQMRVVPVGDGSSEVARARYAGQVGFDLWRRPLPFQPGVSQFWGPNGRMKPITDAWQSFNTISLRPGNPEFSKLPGELGFGPAWTVTNPYLDPPHVLTPAELRANPPPLR